MKFSTLIFLSAAIAAPVAAFVPRMSGARRRQPVSMMAEQQGMVTVYMRDGCPFCVAAKDLLEGEYGMDLNVVNIWEGSEDDQKSKVRDMKTYSGGRQTVPQIFFNSEHIGGNDDVQTLHQDGKLQAMLDKVKGEKPMMQASWCRIARWRLRLCVLQNER